VKCLARELIFEQTRVIGTVSGGVSIVKLGEKVATETGTQDRVAQIGDVSDQSGHTHISYLPGCGTLHLITVVPFSSST